MSEPYCVDHQVYRKQRNSYRRKRTSDWQERYKNARDFATKHFDTSFVRQLEQEDFLIDAPCANDDAKEFENIEQMYADAEASGRCTRQEIERFFSVWNQET